MYGNQSRQNPLNQIPRLRNPRRRRIICRPRHQSLTESPSTLAPTKSGQSHSLNFLSRRKSAEEGKLRSVWSLDHLSLNPFSRISSFGIVWLGKWRGSGVAIKESKLTDPEQREEFFKEAKLLLNLRPHRHVVQVLGISIVEETSTCYLVMELMHKSLDKVVFAAERDLSDQKMLRLAAGIAAGMNHIARYGYSVAPV
jgi:hypothetical protein